MYTVAEVCWNYS